MGMSMAEIPFEHKIFYDMTEVSSIADVANSLLANERLLRCSVLLLEDLVDGVTISSVDVRIKRITQESPLEEWLSGAVVTAYQRDLEKEVPRLIHKLLGGHVPHEYNSLITALVMVVGLYGVKTVYSRLFPKKEPQQINNNYQTLINVAGDYIQVSPHRIETAITQRFSTGLRPLIQKAGLDLLRPAKKFDGTKILGPDGIEISSAAIRESPNAIDLAAEEDMDQYPLQNVEIEIRAIDKDHKKRGWAAVVKDVSKNRIRMQIYPTVDTAQIFGKDRIRGDIIVVNKKDENGDYFPSMYHLVKIHNERPREPKSKKS
jgi:hypothetical protein